MAIPKIKDYSLKEASRLPKNKVEWSLDPSRAVLLIHDMQEYFIGFFDKEGGLVSALKKNIIELKKECKKRKIPIIYTAQPGNQDPEDRALLTDFWGPGLKDQPDITAIISQLKPDLDDTIFTKWRYSAFKKSGLKNWMKNHNKDQLIICGIYAHIGILATALDAFMLDIKPFVVSNAIADFSLEEHKMAIEYMAHKCGQVVSCQMILEQIKQKEILSISEICKDIAQILMIDEEEVSHEENLLYLGLDSIRMMTLVDQWKKKGLEITFQDLAESFTIKEWWEKINLRGENNIPLIESLA